MSEGARGRVGQLFAVPEGGSCCFVRSAVMEEMPTEMYRSDVRLRLARDWWESSFGWERLDAGPVVGRGGRWQIL